jgi:septal ring factor EnvC (AmiA/AmiB activator)
MTSFVELEWKSALKALNGHVRALTELAQLHRVQRVPMPMPTAMSMSMSTVAPTIAPAQAESAPTADDGAVVSALRVQMHVLSEQAAQQEARVRELAALLQDQERELDAVKRERGELQARVASADEVLGDVRDAFLSCTQRLGDIDAERERFARVAATLRAQNERLREHVAMLESHAHWLADKIAHVVAQRV